MSKQLNRAAFVLFACAFLPYIWQVVHHETVPSPVTWAIWGTLDAIAFFAMKKENKLNGIIWAAIIGAWTTTILSVFYGKSTMESAEWIAIVGSAIALVVYYWTGDAKKMLIWSQVATLAAGLPTMVKAYHQPWTEDPLAWTLWLSSCICQLAALRDEKWELETFLQPLTFTAIEATMFYLVVVHPFLH